MVSLTSYRSFGVSRSFLFSNDVTNTDDIFGFWKKKRRMSLAINYESVPISLITLPALNLDSSFLIEYDNRYDDDRIKMLFDSEDEFLACFSDEQFVQAPRSISIPSGHDNLTDYIWDPTLGYQYEDVESLRAGLASNRSSLLSAHFEANNSQNAHFLDLLIRDQDNDQFDIDNTLRSTMVDSEGNFWDVGDDLLSKDDFRASEHDQDLLQMIQDSYTNIAYDNNDASYGYVPDELEGSQIVGESAGAGIDASLDNPSVSVLSNHTRKRRDVVFVDEATRLSHEFLKKTINKNFKIPDKISDSILVDSNKLTAHYNLQRLLRQQPKRIFTPQIAIFDSKSSQSQGIISYLKLAYSAILNAPVIEGQRSDLIEEDVVSANASEMGSIDDRFSINFDRLSSHQDQIAQENSNYNINYDDDYDHIVPGQGNDEPNTSFFELVTSQLENSQAAQMSIGDQLVGDHATSMMMNDFGDLAATPNASFYAEQLRNEEYQNKSEYKAKPIDGVSKVLLTYLAVKSRPRKPSLSKTSTSSASRLDFSIDKDAGSVPIDVEEMLDGCRKRTVARTFFHLLELASAGKISIHQNIVGGPISVFVPD